MPPKRKPRNGDEATDIFLDWKKAANDCATQTQKLINWYANEARKPANK